MSTISKIRNARTTEDMANEIEPLAQALATLADQATEHLHQQQSKSEEHTEQWIQAQLATSTAWAEASADLKQAANTLTNATNHALKATNGLEWRLIALSLMTSILPMLVLLSVFWIWLDPLIVAKDGIAGIVFHTSD